MQFFEKNLPSGAPSWLHTVAVPSTGSRGGGDTILFPVIDGLADLTYFANLASLELHVHQWAVGRNGQPKNPNRMVIDLDPGQPAGLQECCQVALLVRDKLEERGLSSAPGDLGQQGPAHVRRAARQAQLRAGPRPGPGDRAGAHGRAPQAGGLEDDQVAARRQGVPRLDPEHRRQDDHLAVLPARPRAPLRRRARAPGRRSRTAPTRVSASSRWTTCSPASTRTATSSATSCTADPSSRDKVPVEPGESPRRAGRKSPVKYETRRSRDAAVSVRSLCWVRRREVSRPASCETRTSGQRAGRMGVMCVPCHTPK